MAVNAGDATDHSDWMKTLPESLYSVPLSHLAIPGTHNSFTYYLDKSGNVEPGAPDMAKTLVGLFGVLGKKIIKNWSKNQSLGVGEQLRAGVRYFDIRVSTRLDSSDLFVVHGLYGPTVDSCLNTLAEFLNTHCYEIVLLDFNHFYDMNADAHDRLIKALLDRFSTKMCPVMDVEELSLRMMWDAGLQLVVFYHCDSARRDHFQLWSGSSIRAPWHNTASCSNLVAAVDCELCSRQSIGRNTFHVTQGILTPDGGFIVARVGQKLRGTMAGEALRPFQEWLQQQQCGSVGVNVVTVDFIELMDIVSALLNMNHTMALSLTKRGHEVTL